MDYLNVRHVILDNEPKGDCIKCGQPLPEIMSCEEWKKAGDDLIRQVMQKGGLISTLKCACYALHGYDNHDKIDCECPCHD